MTDLDFVELSKLESWITTMYSTFLSATEDVPIGT